MCPPFIPASGVWPRFMGGIRSEVERVNRQLHLFSATLEEWLACQKDWMYLKTIFTAPDIQRQLPHEAKAFTGVDKQFKEVMRRTRQRTNAMQATTVPGAACYMPALLAQLSMAPLLC